MFYTAEIIDKLDKFNEKLYRNASDNEIIDFRFVEIVELVCFYITLFSMSMPDIFIRRGIFQITGKLKLLSPMFF